MEGKSISKCYGKCCGKCAPHAACDVPVMINLDLLQAKNSRVALNAHGALPGINFFRQQRHLQPPVIRHRVAEFVDGEAHESRLELRGDFFAGMGANVGQADVDFDEWVVVFEAVG